MKNYKNWLIFTFVCVFSLTCITLIVTFTPVAFWLPLVFVNNCVVFKILDSLVDENQKK